MVFVSVNRSDVVVAPNRVEAQQMTKELPSFATLVRYYHKKQDGPAAASTDSIVTAGSGRVGSKANGSTALGKLAAGRGAMLGESAAALLGQRRGGVSVFRGAMPRTTRRATSGEAVCRRGPPL